jgi:hypothetical protein
VIAPEAAKMMIAKLSAASAEADKGFKVSRYQGFTFQSFTRKNFDGKAHRGIAEGG